MREKEFGDVFAQRKHTFYLEIVCFPFDLRWGDIQGYLSTIVKDIDSLRFWERGFFELPRTYLKAVASSPDARIYRIDNYLYSHMGGS